MIHKLKTHPKEYTAIAEGIKTFEYRLNDRNYSIGDVLLLEEWNPITQEYTRRKLYREVTYILADKFSVPENYVIMSIAKIK